LCPLALSAEVERNDDSINGHEILADLIGTRHVRKYTGESQCHQTLDGQKIGQTLDDVFHNVLLSCLVSILVINLSLPETIAPQGIEGDFVTHFSFFVYKLPYRTQYIEDFTAKALDLSPNSPKHTKFVLWGH
jgi:hypothetical protein